MRFAFIFRLPDRDGYLLDLVPDKFDGGRGIEHGAEQFLFFAYDVLSEVALVNIPVGEIHVPVLEQDPFSAGFDKILICERSDSERIHEHDLILCAGNGKLVRRRHIIKLGGNFAASAAEERFSRDLNAVSPNVSFFYCCHLYREALDTSVHAQLRTPVFQVFCGLQFSLGTA